MYSAGKVFQLPEHGGVSEEGKKSAVKIRQILLRAKPGEKKIGNISARKVSGAVLSTVNKIAQVFGRRVVFFASDGFSASLPNGFIDKRDPMEINGKTLSCFAPTAARIYSLVNPLFSKGGWGGGGSGSPPGGPFHPHSHTILNFLQKKCQNSP